MPLGMEVGLGPGYVVLDGDPAPSKSGTAPSFWPMSIVATAELLSLKSSLLPLSHHNPR